MTTETDWRLLKLFAHTFASPFSFSEMAARLRSGTKLNWVSGDSDGKGSFVFAHIGNPRSSVQLFEEKDRFVLNVDFWTLARDPEGQLEWKEVHQRIRDEIFPILSPSGLREEEYFE